MQETEVQSLGREDALEKENGSPLQYILPAESHGHGSLVGYSSWGSKESDSTEQLTFNISMLKLRIW